MVYPYKWYVTHQLQVERETGKFAAFYHWATQPKWWLGVSHNLSICCLASTSLLPLPGLASHLSCLDRLALPRWKSLLPRPRFGLGKNASTTSLDHTHIGFLIVFHCNYVLILYCFRDTISYFPKFKEVTWPWTHPIRGYYITRALRYSARHGQYRQSAHQKITWNA